MKTTAPTGDKFADPLDLAARVDLALPDGLATQQRMFGGICFLIKGNILCCASRSGLMARVGTSAEAKALEHPHVRPCIGNGRKMPGYVMVEPQALTKSADLKSWVAMARAFVETLPPKVIKKPVKTPHA